MSKLLLIEDDPFIREMYISKMEQEGYEVLVSEDGESAFKTIKSEKPDLILLDIVLPKMDGFTLLRKIKEDKDVKDLPVIILSNLGHKNDIKKGLSLGADEYIVKSHYTPSEVLEKIKKVLN